MQIKPSYLQVISLDMPDHFRIPEIPDDNPLTPAKIALGKRLFFDPIPSLRNVEYTAPYMHDGSFATLEEVLEHYVSGGMPHQNRDPLIQNIILTEQDKKDVIAFLKTLSDPDFINNLEFRPD